jgi:hypothetical protein
MFVIEVHPPFTLIFYISGEFIRGKVCIGSQILKLTHVYENLAPFGVLSELFKSYE